MSCDLTTSLNFIVLIKFMVEEMPRRVPMIYSSFCYSFIFNLNVIARCSVSVLFWWLLSYACAGCLVKLVHNLTIKTQLLTSLES